MSKLSQVLLLNPAHELRFQGPYKTDVTSNLELNNPTDHPVAFKVKTTAPKRYCVRPNSGIIDPKQTMRLVVILRSFDKDPPTDQPKDKFMVQSLLCEEGTVWSEDIFKDAAPDKIMDSKIRCAFDHPAQGQGTEVPPPAEDKDKPVQVEESKKEFTGDYSSAVDAIAQLREENSRLLREKLDLQEEAAKLRKRASGLGVSADTASPRKTQLVENAPPGVNLSMEILAVAFLVTFVVALLIGKTVL